MGSKKYKRNGVTERNKESKHRIVSKDKPRRKSRQPKLTQFKVKRTESPKMKTQLLDIAMEKVLPNTVTDKTTAKVIENQKKLNIKQTCAKPQKKSRVQKNIIEVCIDEEKTKPWINNFGGTLIQPGPEQQDSDMFNNILTVSESEEFPGWFTPSDTFYSIICKINEHFLAIQKGPLISINVLDNIQADSQLSSSRDNNITVKIANILEYPNILNFPGGIKGTGDKWLIPENNEYIAARKNYLKTKLSTDDSAVEDILSTQYTKLLKDNSMKESLFYKISQYYDNFAGKIPKDIIDEFFPQISKQIVNNQLSLEDMLNMIVKSTLFLRNEFNTINQNLIAKIKNQVLKPKQIIGMSFEELLPELYFNPALDIMVKREELDKKITMLVKETIKNIVNNILLYKMIIDRSKFSTHAFFQQSTEDLYPLVINKDAYLLNDIVPLQNICSTRVIQEDGKQVTIDDLDEIGGVVFYKEDEKLYAFTMTELYNIVNTNSFVNPFTGITFTENFANMIKSLNFDRVAKNVDKVPSDHWKPTTYMELTVFGSESDTESNPDLDQVPDTLQDPDVTQSDPDSLETSTSTQSTKDISKPYELIDPDFIQHIEKLVQTMQETGTNYSFDTIKPVENIKHCFVCSKKLLTPKEWVSTINMDRKTGEFTTNVYHIKCLYDAPFKI
jgi:hypothetical protein